MQFTELNLSADLTIAISSQFTHATAIQTSVIPVALANKDILALAQTGSGKTLAFGLPILERVKALRSVTQAIILVPTRELAMQVHDALRCIAEKLDIRSQVLCGGVDKDAQIEALQQRPEIIVATPGRLLDLLNDNAIDASTITTLVLDEADRLVEMGFWSDVQKIVAYTPATRQTMMFSATLLPELKASMESLLTAPEMIEAHQANSVVSEIEEIAYLVNKGSKANVLIDQIKQHGWKQALVFIGAKDNADALCKKLNKAGLTVSALHGNKTQQERETILAEFKQQKTQILVATDLLARGIHIDQLPVVINIELPSNPTTYVHRIGRTGRAGEKGLAVSLVCHGESEYLAAIRQLTNRPLPLQELADFPVTDKPSSGENKRAPRDKQANRRTAKKTSIKQFGNKPKR
ncbi:DEAD/DEAH box helicase [Vibrio renipiscarius]|uniref:DEAD/DEAH box helicase n=1 Tax=Vibrio renipiscarius TaxID=1461322 RepID=A0A0C2JLC4_9VIBR|nr:DEAD/DEAH box helicase [Vibrio renipiscarius]KII75411.1 DEAD/DEAH box helicase [Vibrio renipiscarius]KII78864.1 DEAD/DEAH box helicase [Vibrio renipiscarius]